MRISPAATMNVPRMLRAGAYSYSVRRETAAKLRGKSAWAIVLRPPSSTRAARQTSSRSPHRATSPREAVGHTASYGVLRTAYFVLPRASSGPHIIPPTCVAEDAAGGTALRGGRAASTRSGNGAHPSDLRAFKGSRGIEATATSYIRSNLGSR